MAEISRDNSIRILKMYRQDWDVNSKCPNAHALDKAISDMEKLEKIEQIVNFVRDNESILFDDDIAEYLFEIEQIVNGE